MDNINTPLLPDEVVWLELLKGYLALPLDVMKAIGDRNITTYQMADKGLEEFKQRFRNDETMVSR